MFQPFTRSILDSSSNSKSRWMRPFFCLLLGFLLLSCESEKKYSASEMWNMGTKIDPNIQLVPMTTPEDRVTCEHCCPGCIPMSPKRIKLRMVDMIAVQFENTEAAKNEALKINQYYSQNWLFDDVNGEPVLEDFVQKCLRC